MHKLTLVMPDARLMMVLSLLAMSVGVAEAFTVPSSGSFGYTFYDTVVLKMLGGPVGWVGAVFLFVFGISQIMNQWMITLACVIGATCIVKMTTILTSLGALVP